MGFNGDDDKYNRNDKRVNGKGSAQLNVFPSVILSLLCTSDCLLLWGQEEQKNNNTTINSIFQANVCRESYVLPVAASGLGERG